MVRVKNSDTKRLADRAVELAAKAVATIEREFGPSALAETHPAWSMLFQRRHPDGPRSSARAGYIDDVAMAIMFAVGVDPESPISDVSDPCVAMWVRAMSGDLDGAETIARERLEAAASRTVSNAEREAHDAHQILGHVALRRGHVDVAVKELVLAGRSVAELRNEWFGPNMSLCDELLKAGEFDPVAAFTDVWSVVWREDFATLARGWGAAIRSGVHPAFETHLRYGMPLGVENVSVAKGPKRPARRRSRGPRTT